MTVPSWFAGRPQYPPRTAPESPVAEVGELADRVRVALVRRQMVTAPAMEALEELCRRCDSLMVRAGIAETYIPAARYDAYKGRLRAVLSLSPAPEQEKQNG